MTIYVATITFGYDYFGFNSEVRVQKVFRSYPEAKQWATDPNRIYDAYEEAHWYRELGQNHYVGIVGVTNDLTPNDFTATGYEIRDFEMP